LTAARGGRDRQATAAAMRPAIGACAATLHDPQPPPACRSNVSRAQPRHAPQRVATPSSTCSCSNVRQPSWTAAAMARSETRWQTQTIMRHCNANDSHLQDLGDRGEIAGADPRPPCRARGRGAPTLRSRAATAGSSARRPCRPGRAASRGSRCVPRCRRGCAPGARG